MKIKSLSFASIAALVVLLSAFIAAPAAVSAQAEDDTDTDTGTDLTNVSDVPVTGTTNDGGTFAGTFSINEFVSGRDGELLAVGMLTGEVTDAAGSAVEQITEESVTIPITSEGFGGEGVFCGDFSVSLGPADIDLSTPDDDVPEDDGTPEDDGIPDDGTSEDGATDEGTRDDDASDDATPDEVIPEEVNPDEINPDDDAADDSENDDASDDSENDDAADEVEADLHLDAVTFNVSAGSGDVGAVVGDVLCNLSGLFGDELDSASIASLLNLILQLS